VTTIDVGIIGAGAAGIFCAANIGALVPGIKVIVFEATQSPLTKVKISGGGRCNVTHNCFDPAFLIKSYPRGFKELRGAFAKFQPQDTLAWFKERGVALKVEPDGRMFPVTDSSQTVIDCLMQECDRHGVKVFKGQKIVNLKKVGGSFSLTSKSGEVFNVKNVVIATGSAPEGHVLAANLGHRITPLAPSLFTFKISDPRLVGFAGISFAHAPLFLTVSGEKETQHFFSGPLLITHWGLSGPAVLKLSAFAAHDLFHSKYQATLKVNFADMTKDQVEEQIKTYATKHSKQLVANHSVISAIPQRWWSHLCKQLDIEPELRFAELKATQRQALADELSGGVYKVTGKGVFKEEFVTAGGIDLQEVDFRTMESKKASGLFFSGEVLNVDGITGGFNFQNAWTTAILVARAINTQLNPRS
jgi:predicted Rossmann fold flavoprotein